MWFIKTKSYENRKIESYVHKRHLTIFDRFSAYCGLRERGYKVVLKLCHMTNSHLRNHEVVPGPAEPVDCGSLTVGDEEEFS